MERATRARLGAPRARDGHGGCRADAGVAGCGAIAPDKRDCGWHTVGSVVSLVDLDHTGQPTVYGDPLLGVAARALQLRRQWLHLDANLARHAGTEPRVLIQHAVRARLALAAALRHVVVPLAWLTLDAHEPRWRRG